MDSVIWCLKVFLYLKDNFEIITFILIFFFSSFLFSYTISSVSAILNEFKTKKMNLNSNLRVINNFMS